MSPPVAALWWVVSLLDTRFAEVFASLIALTACVCLSERFYPKKHAWEGHLHRLWVINFVAVALFVISVCKIALEFDYTVYSRMNMRELALPGVGVLASLTYFFGFFGVSVISSLVGEEWEAVANSNPNPNPKEIPAQPEVIVIGGGVAGCTTAYALAKEGRRVTLIERDLSEQDRIVGELLQPGGIRALQRLGIDDCAKQDIDSVHVRGYVVIQPPSDTQPAKEIVLKYPESDPSKIKEYFGILQTPSSDPSNSADDTQPRGRSFHHGRFVQRLRGKCISHPMIDVIEGTVTSLLEDDKARVLGVRYKVNFKGNTEIIEQHAPLTIIADGIWSGLRSKLSDAKPTQASSFVGIVVDHPSNEPPVPHPGYGHVILAQPSPVLIYQISSTDTRVLVDIQGPIPSQADGALAAYMATHVAPQLPAEFRQSFLNSIQPKDESFEGVFKSMPARHHSAYPSKKRGAVLIGDALNMRHPLTGGGMTVAIRDAETLASLLNQTDLSDCAAVNAKYNMFLEQRKGYASTINVLANALHSVFSTPGGSAIRQDLRCACFDYLSLGGCFTAGPIGLLSGLTPKPFILATHFFMVALFGVGTIFLPSPSFSNAKRVYQLLQVACGIIMPLLTLEHTTLLSFWPIRKMIQLLFPWD